MNAQPSLFGSGWIVSKDGDATLEALHRRHYSRRADRPGERRSSLVIGPGRKLAMVTPCAKAVFAWRLALFRRDGQEGVECTIFRNEGAGRSSDLIRAADAIADERFGPLRHFTFVDPEQVRSPNPGFCFLAAGWSRCGVSRQGLLILERMPA